MVKAAIRAVVLSIAMGIASLACVGADKQATPPAPVVTVAPVFPEAPVVITGGDYCAGPSSTDSRLEKLAGLQNNFGSGPGTLKSESDNKKLSDYLVLVIDEGKQSFVQGFYVGDGYNLTVRHGVTERVLVQSQSELRLLEVWVGYQDEGSKLAAENKVNLEMSKRTLDFGLISALTITASGDADMALLYAPTPFSSTPPPFRLSKDLKQGEKVYMLAFKPDVSGPVVLTGVVTSLAGRKEFSGQFQTSIKPYGGASGAPIFDKEGRVIGLLSGPIIRMGAPNELENYVGSYIAGIDDLVGLMAAERGALGCPK